jgi:hypothetical protein
MLLSMVPAAEQVGNQPLLGRELVFRVQTIVLAAPVDARKPGQFRLLHQLKGPPMRAGQEFSVEGHRGFVFAEGEPKLASVRQALLYLKRGPDAGRYILVPGGVRYLTKDQRVWRPQRLGRWALIPEDIKMQPEEKVEWTSLLDQVAEDVAQAQRLDFLRHLPAGNRRNAALLEWLQCHRAEFRTEHIPAERLVSLAGMASAGSEKADVAPAEALAWGELEQLPFTWILDSAIAPDCWRAVQLYAEIHSGQCLGLKHWAFASPVGRAFLADRALADSELAGVRRRALRLLSSPATLRPQASRAHPAVAPMTASEQTQLLDHLGPLVLQNADEIVRGAAARTLLEISRPLAPGGEFARNALPALVQAYKAEKPGLARDALADAVRQIGGAQHWKEVTGMTHGLAGFLQSLEGRDDRLLFWLILRADGLRVQQQPTLILERLGFFNRVMEKKTWPLPTALATPIDWKAGWDAAGPLYVETNLAGLEPGPWRLYVEGTAGPDKARWRTEPRLVKVISTQKPGVPYPVNPMQPAPRAAQVPPED